MEGDVVTGLHRLMYHMAVRLVSNDGKVRDAVFDVLNLDNARRIGFSGPVPVIVGSPHTREPFWTISKTAAKVASGLLGKGLDEIYTLFKINTDDEVARARFEGKDKDRDLSNLFSYDEIAEIRKRWKPMEGVTLIEVDNNGAPERAVEQVFGHLVRKGIAEQV